MLKVDDDVDLDAVADRLADLGWTEPDEEDGVWIGGPDVLAGVGETLTPELQHVALLADEGLVLTSDQAPFLEQVLEGDGAPDDLADLAGSLDEPLAAAVYDGAYACEHLAMAQADDDARAEADQLVDAAGEIHPLTGFAMGVLPGGDVRAVMQVEDADDAPGDAEARARLAAGPAPGQGGDFGDRFSVERAGSAGARGGARPAPGRGQLRAVGPHQRPGAVRHLLSAGARCQSCGLRGLTPRRRSISSCDRWSSDSLAAMISVVVSSDLAEEVAVLEGHVELVVHRHPPDVFACLLDHTTLCVRAKSDLPGSGAT